jgi:hypothetical protein
MVERHSSWVGAAFNTRYVVGQTLYRAPAVATLRSRRLDTETVERLSDKYAVGHVRALAAVGPLDQAKAWATHDVRGFT